MIDERQPWDHMYRTKHELGMRDFSSYGHDGYDPNIRYVLEDILIQLTRIADAISSTTETKVDAQ